MLLELLIGAAAFTVIGALSDSDGSCALEKGINSASESMARTLKSQYKNGRISFGEYSENVGRLIPKIAAERLRKRGMAQDNPSYGREYSEEMERLNMEFGLDC